MYKKEPAQAPVVFLTLDTDWCSEEILEFSLALFRSRHLSCTIFATGGYAALQNLERERFEIGWHPNFHEMKAEKHQERLREFQALFPEAVGVASHAMTCNTGLLSAFKEFGLKYDRNLLRYKDAQAQPFAYYNGLRRFSVYWEDDIWFSVEPGARFAKGLLAAEQAFPLFNFHPIHLYMNTVSALHYQTFKPFQDEPEKLMEYRASGYGAFSFFEELVQYFHHEGWTTALLREHAE